MALPSCRLSSAINYTLLSLQERCSLSPRRTHIHTHTHKTHTHTADAEGQTPAECLSPLLLASATARHCGRDGHLLSARLDWKGASGHDASCCSFLLVWAVWSVVLLKCFSVVLALIGVTQLKQYSYEKKFNLNLHLISYKCDCEVVATMLKVIVASLEGTNTSFFQEIQHVLITQKQCPIQNVLDSLKPHANGCLLSNWTLS